MEHEHVTEREFTESTKRLDAEDKRLHNRIQAVETDVKRISDLTTEVRELAVTMKQMVQEQDKTNQRLEALENVPAENWNTLRVAILTAIGSVIGTAIVAAIIAYIN